MQGEGPAVRTRSPGLSSKRKVARLQKVVDALKDLVNAFLPPGQDYMMEEW
jgi:hypothetical protein